LRATCSWPSASPCPACEWHLRI